MNRDLSQVRNDFIKMKLDENKFIHHPITHVKEWLNEALAKEIPEPTAATLSTVSNEGRPSSRIILVKHLDEQEGLWFYTNYESRKASHLKTNPFVSLSFFWPQMERQIRVEGRIEKLTSEQNEAYFNSRPEDSRISAIISPQSQIITSREILENNFKKIKDSRETLKRPDHWGGYRLMADRIEFWQGRAGRLHDRILFELTDDVWNKKRLAP